jgi:hypothetical protein
VILLGELCESFAASSAFTLPVMLLRPGTHINDMFLPTNSEMWQDFWKFLGISADLSMFYYLYSALRESDSMTQRLSSPDWKKYLSASGMAMDSAVYSDLFYSIFIIIFSIFQ